MKMRPTVKLEWEVKDESNVLGVTRTPQGNTFPHHASKMWRRWPLVVFAATLLLLACFIGVACLVDRAERNIAQTEREIVLAVEADSYRQDPTAPKPHVQSIELQNDLAIVHTSGQSSALSGRSPGADGTIFYRQSDGGWEHVESNEQGEPDRGPYRYQETTHLLFQYYQVDQGLVEAVVPAVEAFITDLARDSGLGLPPVQKKVTVRIGKVAATQSVNPFELVGYISWDNDGIAVLSPRLLRGSTTLATADTLTQAVNATVAHRTILLAVEEYQPQAVWRPLLDGLQLWAYSTYREFDSDQVNSMNNLLRQQLANKALLRLPVLSTLPLPLHNLEESQVTGWQQSVVPKTVIDYMVATYGRRSLARLLDGMHQYDSWQSLIPAVFGVSTEEFESRWQAYLSAQYNLSP